MNNHKEISHDDEIDIRSLFLKLWNGKIYIFVFSVFFVFLASMHLHNTDRKYLVEYYLKPVVENQQNNNFSGLSGLASIGGIELPSSTPTDYAIFKRLISSVEVSEKIFKNKSLIRKIFNNEWNSSINNFSEPLKSKSSVYIDDLKKIIIGKDKLKYIPPDARRLAIYINDNISFKNDKENDFITLSAETSNPKMLLSIISLAVEASDQIMRQRYINFSKEPLAFYKDKMRTARSREHREALAELIAKEEQKLMFASKGKYFTAEPYIEPTISLYPTAPNSKLILLLSLILGSMAGATISLLRSIIIRDKK
jgi:LPS O-antigen subunit length determinant protein (WzzB/FepE family)